MSDHESGSSPGLLNRWPARRWPRAITRIAVLLSLVACVSLAACVSPPRGTRRWSIPRTIADSVHTETLAAGVQLHRLVNLTKPWRAFVLDIDLDACVSVRSVKGGPVAVGRTTTSALLAGLAAPTRPLAAVNADFFLFAPPGIPTGAHIEEGVVVSGPIARPVFTMSRRGEPAIGQLTVTTTLRTPRATFTVGAWNRPARGVPGIIDAAWGVALDSTIARTVWQLVPVAGGRRRFVATERGHDEPRRARADTLFVVELPDTGNTRVLRTSDTVEVVRMISPHAVNTAVGGFPILLRGSNIAGGVDSANNAAFRGLNPRTAVGYASGGRRLLLVVIDGRQPGYSVGMTLRETAALLRELGAQEGLNLDGGGSSALAIVDDSVSRNVRLVNKPSDAVGERAVANALAVVRTSARSSAR